VTVRVLGALLEAVTVSDSAPEHDKLMVLFCPTVIGFAADPPAGAIVVEIGIGVFTAFGVGLLLNFLRSLTIGVYLIAAPTPAANTNSKNSFSIHLR
jgi:hypothetical protein